MDENALTPVEAQELISDDDADALVHDLEVMQRHAALDFALRAGRMVIERVYGGSIEAWRTTGEKNGSFRKVAARLDPKRIPGLSSSSLSRAVSVYDIDRRVGVSGRPQLNAAHVQAVIGLSEAQQERLLGQAESNDWPANRLKKEAEKLKLKARQRATEPRPGRPPQPAFVRTVNRWAREDAKEEQEYGGLDQIATLDDAEAERLEAAVRARRARCDALLEEFSRRRGGK